MPLPLHQQMIVHHLNVCYMAQKSFKDLIDSEKPVLIDFYADWCGPCRMLSPMIEEIKKEMGDKVTIVKVDVDRNQQLASALGIMSIPTVMIFQSGEAKWRAAGVQPKQVMIQQLEALTVPA